MFARRWGVYALAAVATSATVVTTAGTASAHTPQVDVTCQGVQVDLQNYSLNQDQPDVLSPNHLTVTIDAASVDSAQFGTSFHQTYVFSDSTTAHTYTVSVVAWDDPSGDNGWTKTFEGTSEPCVSSAPPPTQPTTPPTQPTQPPATTTASTPTPTPTPTPVAVVTPIVKSVTKTCKAGQQLNVVTKACELPHTGLDTWQLVATGLVLLSGGAALVLASRRRPVSPLAS